MKKASDEEKAYLLFKLIRGKSNWGACYDRREHFKRFSDEAIDELVKTRWIIPKKKANFMGISANPSFKKEIFEFIEKNIPHLNGELK